MKPKFKIEMNRSYKLGMNEVVGLREAMIKAFKPIVDALQEKTYWHENLKSEDAEYTSRDGFIANSDNRGGLIIDLVLPSCERMSFDHLVEFGECDGCNDDCSACTSQPNSSGECMAEVENYLDARLRIWFKFEGVTDDGKLQFYINACGGNGDAPYFRIENLTDLFEASFTASSLEGIQRASAKHINKLTKLIRGK